MADKRKEIVGGLGRAAKRLFAERPDEAIKGELSAVRNVSRAEDEALEIKRLALEAANPPIKASEAYGKHEGSYLKPIFYDRMKVDLSKRKLGGPGFSGIQLVDPYYKDVKAAAGVTDQKMGTLILNRNKAHVPEGAKVIWTPSVGGLEQHKSNSTMFGEFADIFTRQRKNMSAEEIQKLSDRASIITDKKGRLIFPDGIDLGARNFRQQVKTYPQRSLMADIFAGRGVGGEKGRTVPVEELLEKNLDPNVANAGTLDLGNRLFRLDGSVIDRPDLHSDYRKILTGDDLGVNYTPVPIRDVYTDWEAQKALELAAKGTPRAVTLMDYTKNDPTVQLTEELLSKLQKAGYKKGGAVDIEAADARLSAAISQRMARGGKVDIEAADARLGQAIAQLMAGNVPRETSEGVQHMGSGGKADAAKGLKNVFTRVFQETPPPTPKVRPPSDNVANVRQANFSYPKVIGNQTVKIDKLSGGVRMSDPNEVKRVKALADKIASPEGYISRIIVDHNDNVIEGQHRLEALRQLGVKDVPVYKIEDLAETMPVLKMEEAMRGAGGIHSDHVNQLMQHLLEDIAENGIGGAGKLDYGKWQKHYDAALEAASKTEAPAYNEITGMVSKIGEEGRSPIVPVPNRWFLQPDKFPNQQKLIERVLQKTGKSREDFPSGAFIDPRTGEVLDSRIMDDLGVVIDPKTNRPMMSAKGESGIEQLDPKTGAFTKSNLVRKGLFKPEGGDPLLNDLSFLATIEKGDVGHKYGLATEYASPAELWNTGTGANPTLRPRSRGDLFGIGDIVGQARVGRSEPHDVYEKLFVAPKGSDVQGVKLSKANGGAMAEGGPAFKKLQFMAGGGTAKGAAKSFKRLFAEAPQEEALRKAQHNATLPKSQYGLELAPGNTAAQRLKAMGFNTDAYHATDADIIKFDNAKLGTNTNQNTGGDLEAVKSAMRGHWFSDRDLTNKDPRGYMFGDVSYPVKLLNPKKINDKEFGSISYVVKDPDNIRSPFAAGDPHRRSAAIAAAMGVAAPDLLAKEFEKQKKAQGGVLHMVGGGTAKGVGKGFKRLFADPAESFVASGRKGVEDGRGGNTIIKEGGGNWMGGEVERGLKGLKRRDTSVLPITEAEVTAMRNAGYTVYDPVSQTYTKPNPTNQFVDKQLTKYVKNQMGTKDDPIRLAADAFPAQKAKLLAEKRVQIDKATADMEKARQLRGYTPEMMTESQKIIRKLEKEQELIEHREGLHFKPFEVHMPPTHLPEMRRKAGMPPENLGQTENAKNWENLADRNIESSTARSWTEGSLYPEPLQSNPWLHKVDPESKVYTGRDLERGLGFDHMMDELRNATTPTSGLPKELLIDPKLLSKWTIPQAAEHVDKINAWRASQTAEANRVIANNAATVLHKDYPDKGMKWVELKTPEAALPEGYKILPDVSNYNNPGNEMFVMFDGQGKAVSTGATEAEAMRLYNRQGREGQLADALKYEGEQLQHCVGGYCRDVIDKKSQIFSFRDSVTGVPYVTVEAKPQDLARAFGRLPEEERLAIVKKVKDENFGGAEPKIKEEDSYWELLDKEYVAKYGVPLPRIVQIKGKGNRAPSEEHLPYVQDFVRSGKFSKDVGDLKNTGLIREGDELMTPSEHADWLLKQLNAPPEGMAEGGAAFKTLQWSKPQHFKNGNVVPFQDADGNVVPFQEEMEDAERPATVNPMMARQRDRRLGKPITEGTDRRWEDVKKNAKEMYEETKAELGSDYKRLRDSPAARAQLAKIWAAGNAGGGPDFLNFINEYVLDPIKSVTVDKVFTKPSSVMLPNKNREDIGYNRDGTRVPKFGSIADVFTTESGVPNPRKDVVISNYPYDNDEPDNDNKLRRIPLGGSEQMIERMQARGLMYGGKQIITDPHTGQQTEINTGRFHPIIEIGGSILTGGGLNAAAKSARKGYQRLTDPARIRASALSRAIDKDVETFTKKPLPRKRGGLAQLNTR